MIISEYDLWSINPSWLQEYKKRLIEEHKKIIKEALQTMRKIDMGRLRIK